MIPVRLTVRNFMCYRGDGTVLDLEGVHLACLSGENGAGKSALLGAITWALWGKARERVGDDELISQGANEMEVDYEFILASCRYRVVRKRSHKGNSGSTILELQMQTEEEGDTWKSLTGHNVRDTQDKITDLLKMEYETFINSAFILQGRADEFTVKNPAERKKVLADILGLEQYDRLEELAKDQAKDRKLKAEGLDFRIKTIDNDLLKRPIYVKELEEKEADLIKAQGELSIAKEELHALQVRHQELESGVRRLEELQTRQQRRMAGMIDVQARIQQNTARKGELETLLSQRKQIEKGYKDWEVAQEEERRFSESIAAVMALQKEQGDLQQKIEAERVMLASEERQLATRVRDLETRIAGRAKLEKQLDDVLKKLDDLQQLKVRNEDTKCQRENLEIKWRTLNAEKDACQAEGNQLAQKLELLAKTHAQKNGHTDCPLCGSGLGADGLDRVRKSFDVDIQKKRAEYSTKSKEMDGVKTQLAEVTATLEKERKQLEPLPSYQQEQARFAHAIAQLDTDQEELKKAQTDLGALKVRLEKDDYARDERKKLAAVAAKIAKAAYSEDGHKAAREKMQTLEVEGYVRRYHSLESAGSELSNLRSSLDTDRKSVENWTAEQQSDLTEIAALQPQVDQLNDVTQQVSAKKQEERELSSRVDELLEVRGELRNKINHCDALQEEKQLVMVQYKTALEEKSIYDDLATAFGKKGIQAMIIENVIPEIEDEANTLLNRMTDGRMNVQFATQRDAKSSKSIIETLDINISDEVGTRAYELYSGGEAFRVNFAVRIALSKLLARRAGAQLQMLVIDEGFGTQDGQGRDKLVSAIRSIQEDFEKILVVTHIEELKGEFPVRIDVVKTETGSYIVTG